MHSYIKDLLNPASLPDPTERVILVQTHISLVLVADHFVYKIKKPVDFGFLDFTTLEKRRHYCEQEVILNRRLARDVYIEVLPVRYDGKSHTVGGENGEIVEFAVKMKKIPEEMLMSSLFMQGRLERAHLSSIALVLAGFHRNAAASHEIDRFGEPEAFRINTDENFRQTERLMDVTIARKDFQALSEWTEDFYRDKAPLFRERIKAGKVRDCHGDLHMAHVCLATHPFIIDCIEFNDRFRYGDTLADIAFLLMDLEYHGGQKEAQVLWELYAEEAGDRGMDELLTFYKIYRAYVRGKVNSFQLDDQSIGLEEKQKAREAAGRYFRLARSYLCRQGEGS